MKLRTQNHLVYVIVLKLLELLIMVIFLILLGKLQFSGFFKVLGTFAHKVAQTLFVLHETLHTTLFGIYYCVGMVCIINYSHILNITL